MSRQLAVSSAISILTMAAFVLFSPASAHVPLGAGQACAGQQGIPPR